MAKKDDSVVASDSMTVEKQEEATKPKNDPTKQYVTVSLPGVPEACVVLEKNDDPEVAYIHYRRHYGINASSHVPKLGEGDAGHANVIDPKNKG